MKEAVCTCCRQSKALSEFSADPRKRNGVRSACKPCRAAQVQARREQQPARHILTLMIQRCHNAKHPKFQHYGGRGITVHQSWRAKGGFALFFAHVGPRPSPGHSIERIENARGYEPGNVRWATQTEQMNNTRRTVRIMALGKTLSISQWAEALGIARRTIVWRRDQGWEAERIVTTPVRKAS